METDAQMTTLQIKRRANDICWTDTYYNGGVEGRALAEWYDREFAPHFNAMDFTADLPKAVSAAPVAAPQQEICTQCRLCTEGAIFPLDPATRPEPARVPGVTYHCALLRRLRASEVDAGFAQQVVQDAITLQNRAIDGFVAAMPDHFGALRPATALQAEEHYVQGRALGVHVNKTRRDNAWFHFDTYRGFIRLNFESGFLDR